MSPGWMKNFNSGFFWLLAGGRGHSLSEVFNTLHDCNLASGLQSHVSLMTLTLFQGHMLDRSMKLQLCFLDS